MTAGTTAFHGLVMGQQYTRQRVRAVFRLKHALLVICTFDFRTAVQGIQALHRSLQISLAQGNSRWFTLRGLIMQHTHG